MSIGVGAFVNGKRPASKKALREAIELNPDSVTFDETSIFSYEGIERVADVVAGVLLMVVGPDPYTKRNFYGTIERNTKGKIVVK